MLGVVNGQAIPEGFRWRIARALLAMFAMLLVLTTVGEKLSFGDAGYAIGYIVVLFLTTLTDRTDFYFASPYVIDPPDQSEGPATWVTGPGVRLASLV